MWAHILLLSWRVETRYYTEIWADTGSWSMTGTDTRLSLKEIVQSIFISGSTISLRQLECLLSCFCGVWFFKTSFYSSYKKDEWNSVQVISECRRQFLPSMYLSFLQNWSDSLLIQNSCERNERSLSFLCIDLK